MTTILNSIFLDERKIAAQDALSLVSSYRERKKTGAIRLGYDSGQNLHLLFKRGEMLNAYWATPEKREAATPQSVLEEIPSAGETFAKDAPLSAFGLLILKLLIQSTEAAEEVTLPQPQIAEWLAKFEGGKEPALVHLAWKNAAGAIFFSPQSDPHFLFISKDIILDETGSYKALCNWNENECVLTVFTANLQIEAWQEYYLQNAFKYICEGSFSRFEVLTGRALVDSLARLINVFASRQRMDLSITARKLEDKEVFSSPQQALYMYRRLLAELFDHFSAVIGARLYISTMREIIGKLPAREIEIVRRLEVFSKGYFYE